MSLPRLSVVLPNYNHGHFLRQSLDAIISQLRPSDELIVLDDASTDDSREIISEFSRRFDQIRPVFTEENRGVVANINRGVAMAKNDYVYLGAADDYMLPGFVDITMAAAQRYPQAGIIACDPGYQRSGADTYEMFPLQLGEVEHYFSPEVVVAVRQALEAGIGMTTHASIVRREALLEAGCFQPSLEFCCDWFVLYVIVFRAGFVYAPHKGAIMRVDPTTYSGAGWSSKERRRRVLLNLAHMIMSEPYRDVRAAFAESGVLRHFHPDMLQLALRSSDVRRLTRSGDVWYGVKYALRQFGLNRLVPEPLKIMRRRRERSRARRALNVDP
jgi:glycosyltransferase involved in cell wall biosynthesis